MLLNVSAHEKQIARLERKHDGLAFRGAATGRDQFHGTRRAEGEREYGFIASVEFLVGVRCDSVSTVAVMIHEAKVGVDAKLAHQSVAHGF